MWDQLALVLQWVRGFDIRRSNGDERTFLLSPSESATLMFLAENWLEARILVSCWIPKGG